MDTALSTILANTQSSTLSRNELHSFLLSHDGYLELSTLDVGQPPPITFDVDAASTTSAPFRPNQQFSGSQPYKSTLAYGSPTIGLLPSL